MKRLKSFNPITDEPPEKKKVTTEGKRISGFKPALEATPEKLPKKQQPYYDPQFEMPGELQSFALREATQLLYDKPSKSKPEPKPKPKTQAQKKADDTEYKVGGRYYDDKTETAMQYLGNGKWEKLVPVRRERKREREGVTGVLKGVALMTNPFTAPLGITQLAKVGAEELASDDIKSVGRKESGMVKFERVGDSKDSPFKKREITENFKPNKKIDKATGKIDETWTHPAELGVGLTLGVVLGGPAAAPWRRGLRAAFGEYTFGLSDIGKTSLKKVGKEVAKTKVGKAAKEVSDKVSEISKMPIIKRKAKVKDSVYNSVLNLADDADKELIKKNIARTKQQDIEIAQAQKLTWKERKAKFAKHWTDDKKKFRDAIEGVAEKAKAKMKAGNLPKEEMDALEAISRTATNAKERRFFQHGASNEALVMMKEADKTVFKGVSPTDAEIIGEIRESLRSIEIAGRETHKGFERNILHDMARKNKTIGRFKKDIQKTYETWEGTLPKGIKKPKGFKGTDKEYIEQIWKESKKIKTVKVSGKVEEHEAMLRGYQKAYPKKYDEWIKKSKQLDEIYNKQIEQFVEEGRLSRQAADDMIAKGEHYNPRLVLDKVDPRVEGQNIGRQSGLAYLETGTEKTLLKDPRYLLNDYLSKSQTVIFKNRANKGLYEFAKVDDSGLARVLKKGEKISSSEEKITAFVKGEEVEMAMPTEIAKEWKGLDPVFQQDIAASLNKWTGARMLQAYATGVNPFFPVRNIYRDMQYLYMSPEYSTFLPKFIGQVTRDYASAAKDIIFNKGVAREYSKIGGGFGSEGLTRMGRFKESGTLTDRRFRRLMDFAGAGGQFSEDMGRVAHTKRAMRNGHSFQTSAFIARDALDFAQGGVYSKAVNTVVPYFNVGILGTRGFYRFYKKDPKMFKWKMAQLGAVATGAYAYNTQFFKEDYAKVAPYLKATNWVFMLPWTYIDDIGEEQRYHLDIPKDHSQMFFTSIVDNVNQAASGEEVNINQALIASKNFLDVVPNAVGIPVARAFIGMAFNLDTYRAQQIWKTEDIEGKIRGEEEYIEGRTPKLYEYAGKATKEVAGLFGGKEGLSPVKMEYAVEQFVSSSNAYANFFGVAVDAALKKLTTDERVKISDKVAKELGMGIVRKTYRDEDKIAKATEEAIDVNTERVLQKRDFEKQWKEEELERAIETQPDLRKEWAGRRIESKSEAAAVWNVAGKKNYALWKQIGYSKSPEASARMFYKVFKDSEDYEEQKLKAKILSEINVFSQNLGEKFSEYLAGLEEADMEADINKNRLKKKFVPVIE